MSERVIGDPIVALSKPDEKPGIGSVGPRPIPTFEAKWMSMEVATPYRSDPKLLMGIQLSIYGSSHTYTIPEVRAIVAALEAALNEDES